MMKTTSAAAALVFAATAALAALTLFWTWWHHRRGASESFFGFHGGGDDSTTKTIFVSVASFRDVECSNTVRDLFAKAVHPERVFVGTCEQNELQGEEADGESCVGSNFKWAKNVRRILVPYTEAGGPTVARYFCSLLFRDEDYFLQIDSHSEFVRGWDDLLVKQQSGLPDPSKGVLTGYPRSLDDSRSHPGIAVICKSKFDRNGVPTFESVILDVKNHHFPVSFLAGGFIFAPGSFLRDVPFDNGLEGLFAGEEILLSARAWTAGYDFYAPTHNAIYHHYVRKGSPKFWDLPNKGRLRAKQAKAVDKVKLLMSGKTPSPGYAFGMGKARSVHEYNAFATLDWDARTSSSFDKFCSAGLASATASATASTAA